MNPFVLRKTRAIFSAEGNLFFQPQRPYLNSGENNIALIKLTVASVHSTAQMHNSCDGIYAFRRKSLSGKNAGSINLQQVSCKASELREQ